MKRRIRKPALVIAVLLLLVSVSLMFKSLNFYAGEQDLAYEKTGEFIYEDFDNIKFQLDYTNNKKLNKALESQIENLFNENLTIFENKDKVIRGKLSLNNEKNLASWVFIEESENLSEVYGSMTFNTINNEFISYEKIYGENFKALAMQVRNKLAMDNTLRYNQKIYTQTLPEIESFKYICFGADKVSILFKGSSFDLQEALEVDFTYKEIMPFFSEEFLAFIDKDYVKVDLTNIRYLDPYKPMVAMTFDDGPTPGASLEISEYFADQNARVTFFWLGSRIESYQEIVETTVALGHEISNHSYNHPSFVFLNDQELKRQSEQVSNQIRAFTNQKEILLRPPFGDTNEEVRSKLDNPLILWSVDPQDWKYRDSDYVYSHIDANIYDGGIILLHDLYDSSVDAAKRILDKYKDTYQFVTVSEMFAYKGIPLESGQLYFDAEGR